MEPESLLAHQVVSVAKACRGLGVGRSRGLAWLASKGLVTSIGGAKRVHWGSVLDALRDSSAAPSRQAPRVARRSALAALPRVAL